MIIIRPAALEDAAAIAEIYNEAILTTVATFDTEPKTVEERQAWLRSHDERHPVLVGVVDGHVAGWASLARGRIAAPMTRRLRPLSTYTPRNAGAVWAGS